MNKIGFNLLDSGLTCVEYVSHRLRFAQSVDQVTYCETTAGKVRVQGTCQQTH